MMLRTLIFAIATAAVFVVAGCERTEEQSSSVPKAESVAEADSSERVSQNGTEDELEGRWLVQSIDADEDDVELDDPWMPDAVEFHDGLFTLYANGETVETMSEMRIRIDESVAPAELDLMRDWQGRSETLPCIIEMDDGNLRIAIPLVLIDKLPTDPLSRPTSFDTSAGDRWCCVSRRRSESSAPVTG
jgi:uncharacterized protein (TIGR03067 family)